MQQLQSSVQSGNLSWQRGYMSTDLGEKSGYDTLQLEVTMRRGEGDGELEVGYILASPCNCASLAGNSGEDHSRQEVQACRIQRTTQQQAPKARRARCESPQRETGFGESVLYICSGYTLQFLHALAMMHRILHTDIEQELRGNTPLCRHRQAWP